MKLLDKLKNALFEEEYVEIEEKPKTTKADKQKKEKKHIGVEKNTIEEKPIAKRIIPPERKTENANNFNTSPLPSPETFMDSELSKPKEEPKFTIVTDDDLRSDEEIYKQPDRMPEERPQPKRRSEIKREVEVDLSNNIMPKEPEPKLYQATKTESYLENYTPHEYGKYEKQKEKEVFKPSPIISPIYGIVSETNQNTRETKQEIRLSSAISHEKMNLDDIRKKAFGHLNRDINNDDNLGEDHTLPNNLLLDLTNDEATPEVNNITMGDAEEYFEDLGLEYNKDYIDKDKTTRSEKNKALDSPRCEVKVEDTNNTIIIKDSKVDETPHDKLPEANTSDEDNLFDLIDSMYE